MTRENPKTGAIPISTKLLEIIKNRQIELIKRTDTIVTLTEVSNDIVIKGLKVIESEESNKVK